MGLALAQHVFKGKQLVLLPSLKSTTSGSGPKYFNYENGDRGTLVGGVITFNQFLDP